MSEVPLCVGLGGGACLFSGGHPGKGTFLEGDTILGPPASVNYRSEGEECSFL